MWHVRMLQQSGLPFTSLIRATTNNDRQFEGFLYASLSLQLCFLLLIKLIKLHFIIYQGRGGSRASNTGLLSFHTCLKLMHLVKVSLVINIIIS